MTVNIRDKWISVQLPPPYPQLTNSWEDLAKTESTAVPMATPGGGAQGHAQGE